MSHSVDTLSGTENFKSPWITYIRGSGISGVRLKENILAAAATALRSVISFAMFRV